jgi:anti-anti-sigma factor
MALSVQSRQVGDITVLTCRGRIAEGGESAQLETQVADLLPHGPWIVLNMAEVSFLDSSGLGLLVKLLARGRRAGGGLRLCALPPRVAEILKMTRLHTTLPSYATEADAITAFYEHDAPGDTRDLPAEILCVDSSTDVLAYVRVLLRQAGYGVMTAANIYDAVILLRVNAPGLVIASADVLALDGTGTAAAFRELAARLGVIELEAGFSGDDAGDAGHRLLERVAKVLGPPATSVRPDA